MKYYAKDNHISTDPIEGGIEITEQEYLGAIEALSAYGFKIIDGALVILSGEMKTVYSTESGAEIEIVIEDETPEGYTETERPDHTHDWNGSEWELNEDKAWQVVRSKRDGLISQSDWTQLGDSPQLGNQAWLDYRQALRDITEQSDPANIEWPEVPE